MKVNRVIYSALVMLFFANVLIIESTEQTVSGALANVGSDILDKGSAILSGLAGSIGYVSSDYVYNYQVWNDASVPVFAASQGRTKIFGANFDTDIEAYTTILPFNNSGDTFLNQKLYIDVWILPGDDPAITKVTEYWKSFQEIQDVQKYNGIGWLLVGLGGGVGGGWDTDAKFGPISVLHKKIDLGIKNDPNLYYYRAYTGFDKEQQKESLLAEYLGLCSTTTDFVGTFYNNTTAEDIILKFKKDGQEYSVTLDSDSFNLLDSKNSEFPNSIRPPEGETRVFSFYKGKDVLALIPIKTVGLGGMVYDQQTKTFSPGDPMPYTYEIYSVGGKIKVGLQGMSIGKHTQPVNGRMRDINPVTCHVWNKSAAQSKSASGGIPYDLDEQKWVTYKTQDSVITKKLAPGEVFDFKLLRPRISEKKAWLYVVSLQTNDDTKAKKFLDRLNAGLIGQDVGNTAVKVDLNKMTTVLTDVIPNTSGIITDTTDKDSSGIAGTVMIADGFLPRALVGPFYYSVEPAELMINDLIDVISSNLSDSLKKDKVLTDKAFTDLSQKMQDWIALYKTDKNATKQQIISYLQTNGVDSLFTNPTASAGNKIFNAVGSIILNNVYEGSVSVAKPPINRQNLSKGTWGPGINWYTLSQNEKPSDWPA